MAKKKVPDSVVAIVRLSYGRPSARISVDVPVKIKFGNLPYWLGNSEELVEYAANEASMARSQKLVNAKEFTAAFKQWQKGQSK